MLIRPRLIDVYEISRPQSLLDFAIPVLDEDIPLYLDPFLLWKSPSQQDQALHTSIINSFNHLNYLSKSSKNGEAREALIVASECAQVGLGVSKNRRGSRVGKRKADEILSLFTDIDHYAKSGFSHVEEIQLYVRGISRDRISDICCSFLKSFLIDYTIQECDELRVPLREVQVDSVYDYRTNKFNSNVFVRLPVNPNTGEPVIFVPKRWLRFSPWINFEEYYRDYCPMDDVFNKDEPQDPVKILRYNRDNYAVVRDYIEAKERSQEDCHNDPLFKQIPVVSAKRKLSTITSLPTGKTDNADRKYEDNVAQLLASLLYPHLDFAKEQSRTDKGTLIRDLVFYNNRSVDFLEEIHGDYGNRQLVFEMKNVAAVNRDHVNQLNRYLDSGLGKFGVLVTRNNLTRAMQRNIVDLWAGQRRCIIALVDEDLRLMTNVFESGQRTPIDVLKKKYIEFRRICPS